MSSENRQAHIERQMAFILDQQAPAEVRWAKADERGKLLDERWGRTEESIRLLHAIAEIHEREIEQLRDAADAALATSQATAESMNELRDAGRATDERLNALINVVERQISERRNGKNQE